MPTWRPVAGNGAGWAHSHEKHTYHLPVLLRLIVAVLSAPSIGRCRRTFTCPTLAMRMRFSSAARRATDRHLREGDALVASTATEAGVPRRLTSFHPAEERLKRQIKAYSDILQYLRMDPSQCWTCGLERGQGRLLVIQTQRLLSLLPHFPAFSQQVIVQPAALLKLLVKETLLLLGWVQAVLECLTHVEIIRLRHTLCQARWAIHPPLESRGFLALFCKVSGASHAFCDFLVCQHKDGEGEPELPRVCPKCKSPYWNVPRRVKQTGK